MSKILTHINTKYCIAVTMILLHMNIVGKCERELVVITDKKPSCRLLDQDQAVVMSQSHE